MSNILIADDNRQICSILSEYAKNEGFEIFTAYDGKAALYEFERRNYEMVLLDVMMPEIDGFEVCRRIRRISNTPVIMITARSEDFEKIMGLDTGADDYIVKPFSPSEVMARIRAILRRISRVSETENITNIFKIDNIVINIDEFTVSVDNKEVVLTKKEIEILWTLATNQNKVFTRENLLSSLWGYEYYGDNRTVDSHIKRLRSKLDIYEHSNWEIKTIWGMGYKFEVHK